MYVQTEVKSSTGAQQVRKWKVWEICYFIICPPILNFLAAHAFYLEVQLSSFHWQYRDPVSGFVFVISEGQVVESISCTEHYAHWLCKNVGSSLWIWDCSDSFKFYQLLFLQNGSNWVIVYSITHLHNLSVHFYKVCNIQFLLW